MIKLINPVLIDDLGREYKRCLNCGFPIYPSQCRTAHDFKVMIFHDYACRGDFTQKLESEAAMELRKRSKALLEGIRQELLKEKGIAFEVKKDAI